MMRAVHHGRVVLGALTLLIAACGGAEGSDTAMEPAPGTGVGTVDDSMHPNDRGGATTPDDDGEIESVLTFSEYQWITDEVVAVVDLEFPESTKRRVFTGANAWRHPSGSIVFTQGCGQDVSRVAVADPAGGVAVVTPCSSEVENPGFSPTLFEFARSSPDQQRYAVEARYYLDDGFRYSTLIYEGEELVQVFDDHWAPTWLDDDTVVLAGSGLFVADVGEDPRSIDGGTLASGTNNPDLDPAGQQVAFEWNQQIWTLNLDGTGLEELVSGAAFYRFPAWAPDGSGIAFLATSYEDNYDKAIYLLDMETREFLTLDIADQLGSTQVPAGPLSWTSYLAGE